MNIILDGREREVSEKCTILDLLEEKGKGKQVVVIVNGNRLLQNNYNTQKVYDGDEIAIIKPLAGG